MFSLEHFHVRAFTIHALLVMVALVLAIRHYLDLLHQSRETDPQSPLVDAIRGRLHDGVDQNTFVHFFRNPINVSDNRAEKISQDGYTSQGSAKLLRSTQGRSQTKTRQRRDPELQMRIRLKRGRN